MASDPVGCAGGGCSLAVVGNPDIFRLQLLNGWLVSTVEHLFSRIFKGKLHPCKPTDDPLLLEQGDELREHHTPEGRKLTLNGRNKVSTDLSVTRAATLTSAEANGYAG